MRKLYSLALLFVATVFCSTAYGYTGIDDITSSKLTNADFSADAPVATTVRTYNYDMPDAGAGAGGTGLYGMQAVTGWTANNPTDNSKHTNADLRDAKAAGVFRIYDPDEYDEMDESELFGLGGAYYCKGDKTKQALGVTSVWGGNGAAPIYSQDVTLDAGYYILVANIYNGGGTSEFKSNEIGFKSGKLAFMSSKTSYPVGEWVEDTILIRLDAEASGQITLGFMDAGVGSSSTQHIFIESVKIYTVSESDIIADAKEELLGLINIGKMYGVDTTASEAVYNNPSATLAEIEAAIENQKEINASGVTDLSPYFIVNSHFDLDDPVEGGICTYAKDCAGNGIPLTNFSMLPVEGWDRSTTTDGPAAGVYAIGSGAFLGGSSFIVPDEMSDGSSKGKVLGFVTSWSNTVQYSQAVTLPKGEYTLSLSYFNAGGTTAINKNLIGFVTDEGKEYLSTKTTFPVGEWTKDEIKFTLDEESTGYFTLGYKAAGVGSGGMPHFFTDGISLMYVGTGIDPTMFALKAAVSAASKIIDQSFYTELKEQLSDALVAGQELVDAGSTDQAANQAAYRTLADLTAAANANIAAYKKLSEFNSEGGALYEAIMKYDEEHYSALALQLGLIDEGATAAIWDYTWDTETIEGTISSLPQVIKDGVQAAWDAAIENGTVFEDEGIDISVLFEGIGENGNFTGWTTTKGSIAIQYNVAEIFNNTPFVASRTLEKMPKGKYTFTTHGFYRIGDNQVNYDDYQSKEMYSYICAGASKNQIPNVAVVTFDAAHKDAFAGLAETSNGSGVYVINNREGASQIFNSAEYGSMYEASVASTLTEEDDLTFGVSTDAMENNNWNAWYQFSIYYNGANNFDLYTELSDQINALEAEEAVFTTYLSDNSEVITEPASDTASDVDDEIIDAIDGAREVANTYDEGTDEFDGYTTEQIIEIINSVKESRATLAEAQKALEENVAAVNECLEARTELENTFNDDTLTPSVAAIDEAEQLLNEDATDDAIAYMETAEVKALTERIKAATGALKVPDEMQQATDENPYDATALIINNSFELDNEGATNGGTNGWSYNTKATGDTGAR